MIDKCKSYLLGYPIAFPNLVSILQPLKDLRNRGFLFFEFLHFRSVARDSSPPSAFGDAAPCQRERLWPVGAGNRGAKTKRAERIEKIYR